MLTREIIIKETHRGLWYEDGRMLRVLAAGRYVRPIYINLWVWRRPRVQVVLVDVRERELTIKGQEILTADKVAIRVNIIVRFRVTQPEAALHAVENYEERLYSDAQLAARRSLAGMTLEEILTNRNRLNEDMLSDVKGTAAGYGVAIIRADVKDLTFPGNVQDVMNRVLIAERKSMAELVEARTRVQVQQIETEAALRNQRLHAETEAESTRLAATAEAEALRIRTEAETARLKEREKAAAIYGQHPALLRLKELETLAELSKVASARIYIGFDKHTVEPGEN